MATKKQLEAQAATNGLFQKATAKDKGKQTAPKKQQATPQPEPKRETATFSVKIDTEVLKRWRHYASMDGYGDKGKLTEAAIVEYMNRHKLTPEQQERLDKLCEL